MGANPTEALIRELGQWALRFLLITLTATPAQRWLGWGLLLSYRRMLGLFSFFYGLLHLIGFVWFEHFFNWQELLEDILKRPFITLGMLALLLLIPLAMTSTRRAVRRFGFKTWQRLHRLVYVAVSLALVHFFLLVKADLLEPLIYLAIWLLLLALRLPNRFFVRWRKPASE
ncbi:MAG: sulfoxide reductase heme-binding subunit YedZ [Immundisolibacteraceae bacterium]|nr:sulfoxide reductase heme-binding subunit YedZ [Immundisolibacteraceae bacterium]